MRITPVLASLLTALVMACGFDVGATTVEQFKSNVQAQYPNSFLATDFDSILNIAIVTKIGNGSRKMIVFLDPYCFYCQQLEKQLRYLTDVTIYTLLLPLDDKSADALNAIERIWCDPRQDVALRDWFALKSKVLPMEYQRCNVPITLVKRAAESIQAQGTPAIIFGSGRLKYGAVSPYILESQLGF
jgi:thiol:disulfide interchange protein DsbC